jgi:peptidase M28-like protein/PDZ domain-containing protein/PA domain-containing protein
MPYHSSRLVIILLLGLILLPVGVKGTDEDMITAEDLIEQVRILAAPEMEGRASGTPGGTRAAAHIAEEFRKIGLQPLGDRGDYLQLFEVATGVRLGTRNRLALDLAGGRKEYQVGVMFQPFSFSAGGQASGDGVFAGYGITASELNYDDYAGLDVQGKIVLVMTHEPQETNPQGPFRRPEAFHYTEIRYKVINAREHGATGIIIVTDPNHPDAERARLFGLRGGGSTSAGIMAVNTVAEVAEAILAPTGKRLIELQQGIDQTLQPRSFVIPGVRVSLEVDLVHEKRQTANVIGLLPGRDPQLKEQALIMGAHYDHLGRGGETSLAPDRYGEIHSGADDNASGVAGVITLAKAFAQAGSSRSLVFIAFAAEEMGLLGSSHYVNHPAWPLGKTYAMINLDAIGRLAHNRLYVLGVDSAQELRPLLKETAKDLPLTLQFSGDGFGPSDHTNFYAKERPVLMFFTGPHVDYHRPSDTLDKINAEGLATVVKLAFKTAATLAQRTEPLTYAKTKGEPPRIGERGSGYGAYFGSIPDFSESPTPGVKLAGVRPDSPAEKAGLKAGDSIVRFAGVTIRTLEDLVFALRSKRAGDRIEVIYLRDGQTHQAQATLGSRH